jgi:two-component system, sensor histidine kinase
MLNLPEELARSALDAAPDAIVIVDEAGIVRFANRQVSALFGYTHEEVIGGSVERLMPERFRGRHVTHRQGYGAALRLRLMGAGLTLFGQRRDGSEFPVEIGLSPIQGGGATLVAAAIRDVTDRKCVEAELKEARASAERANQAKGRFLATASHDLRQPLQTLALLNGALRRMVAGGDAAEVLAQQEQAVGAMSRLLNALLDISKLESGAVRPHPTDFRIAPLLEGLRREFASIAASKGLTLTTEAAEASVHSDPALLEQILKNLLSNAIKYTRKGGVAVRCRRHDAALRIEVADTGVGIPAGQLAYIYDEFYQVAVTGNSSREGYGLGLSIVQRLVRLLNARVEVTSEVGSGSVFTVILPVGDVQGEAVQPAAGATRIAAPTGSPRVLLVEDDPSVRDATRMLLRVEGYRVSAVASLSEALRCAAEEGAPDLLITDYHLHDGELGTEVIAALRARLKTDLKAVLVTGDTSTVVKAMHDDPRLRIASKPVDAEALLALMRALLAE